MISRYRSKNRYSNQHRSQCIQGFTLLEILTVIAILGIVLGISLRAFSNITKQQSLDKDVETAYSYLLKARNQTINGEDGDNYGVHFASSTITLFKGSVYHAASSTNLTFSFGNRTYLSSNGLTNGIYDVYFNKISGSPSATGTLVYKITTDSTVQKIMTIHGSGLVEVQ